MLVEHAPHWVNEDKVELDAEDFKKIYDFFVIHTPVVRLSSRSIPLSEYGWSKPWKKPEYLNRDIKDASNNPSLFYAVQKLDDIEGALNKASTYFDSTYPELEVACFYNNESNQVMSCFCHLRNSLCHGRYRIFRSGEDLWIAVEDKAKTKVKGRQGEKLSARMLLRLSTLMKWIEIVRRGPRSIDAAESKKETGV